MQSLQQDVYRWFSTTAAARFHGPTIDGPLAAACADYRRKLPWASVAELRGRQEQDAEELGRIRGDWAGAAAVAFYRFEVDSRSVIRFADLAGDARSDLGSELQRRTT